LFRDLTPAPLHKRGEKKKIDESVEAITKKIF
jgi:hypothetical protein